MGGIEVGDIVRFKHETGWRGQPVITITGVVVHISTEGSTPFAWVADEYERRFSPRLSRVTLVTKGQKPKATEG